MPRTTTRVTAEEAARNADAITGLYDLARDSLIHCPADELGYGTAAKRLARELARLRDATSGRELSFTLNTDTLGKMRRVAAEYTAEQIADLAARVRANRSRFSTSHLLRLLVITDRKQRDAIASRAVRGSWTLSTLERHAQVARKGRRLGAGRKPFVPADPEQRLVVLEGLALKWLRWTALAADGLPRDLGRLVREADAAVGAVKAALADHLPRTRPEPDDSVETG
jgi:hypothetical protein